MRGVNPEARRTAERAAAEVARVQAAAPPPPPRSRLHRVLTVPAPVSLGVWLLLLAVPPFLLLLLYPTRPVVRQGLGAAAQDVVTIFLHAPTPTPAPTPTEHPTPTAYPTPEPLPTL